MSVQDFIEWISKYPFWVSTYFVLIPGIPVFIGMLQEKGEYRGEKPPWRHVYAALIYLTTFPGVCAAVLTAYSIFFTRKNLLEVNALVYLLPIASMILTYHLIGQRARFSRLPGFDRLSGLLTLTALTFLILLVLYKLRIIVGFFANIFVLVFLAALIFMAMKWAVDQATGKSKGIEP